MIRDEASGPDSVLDGRYRLVRRLGRGGMAAVWVATDERLGREVAVKVLSDVLAEDEGFRRRFEREARVAARLNHPNLVGVLDFGEESGRPYLVMELVRGDTLAAWIASGKASGLDHRALAGELLGALAHIHSAGIVHRDVKPGNVLIGNDGRARLTDFGIARPDDATALTQTGQVVGTLSYMAPEVQRGERATPRSDLYALGLLLRDCGGEQDPFVAALIDTLSASDAADRPASADDALESLNVAALTGPTEATKPLPATEPTRALRGGTVIVRSADELRRWVRPGLLLPVLAALVAAILAVILVSGGDSPQESTRPGEAPAPAVTADRQESEPTSTAPANDPQTTPQVSCGAIEEQKKALDEEKKAAEESAGDDKEAKEQIKAQFEAEKQALEERAKTCPEE